MFLLCFFANGANFFVTSGISSIFVSNSPRWKTMLLFKCSYSTITSSFPHEMCIRDSCMTGTGYVCSWRLDRKHVFERNSQSSGRDPAETAVRQWNLLLSKKQTPPVFSVRSAWRKSGYIQSSSLLHSFPCAWQVPGCRSAGSIPASGGWSFSVLCSGRFWIWSLFALAHLCLLYTSRCV